MDDERAAPAGWYPDSADPGAMRWWDGEQWTTERTPIADPPPAPQERVTYRLPNADGSPTVDAIGEADRREEIADVLGRSLRRGEVVEQTFDVELVPEPDHPTGAPAVSARVDGRVIGYLPDAAGHRAALDRVVASGAVPVTGARLRAEQTEDGLRASLRLALVGPETLVPQNEPPAQPYSLLPWSRGLQVLREAEHFARLAGVVPAGGRGLVLVTLHFDAADAVEVRLDGDRVGELSPAMSTQFAPTLRHLASLGLVAAAYAVLRGSPLTAELTLQASKAADLPAAWVDGPPITLPRLVPVASRYEVPEAYSPPLRPTARTSASAARSTRRTVARMIVGVATLVGLSSWIIGELLN